jgi:hypothetical protein
MKYQNIFSHILASFFVLGIVLSFAFVQNTYADYEYSPLEKAGDVDRGGIIPCTNQCSFDDIFRLINNLVEFFLKTLLFPMFIGMIIYAGYRYITAMGNPSKIADLRVMFGHMLMGLALVLCSFVIVKGILYALGYTEGLMFFE